MLVIWFWLCVFCRTQVFAAGSVASSVRSAEAVLVGPAFQVSALLRCGSWWFRDSLVHTAGFSWSDIAMDLFLAPR
jgi:hypothetical protein